MTETWPPTTPEHVLLTGWRPVPPAELLGYQARLGCPTPLEGLEAVGVCIETQRKESLMVLRPAAEGVADAEPAVRAVASAGERDASRAAAHDLPPDRKAVSEGLDEGRIQQALAAIRSRWARPHEDAGRLRRVLAKLLPGEGRTTIVETHGHVHSLRAFERLGRDRKGRTQWRSMYVWTEADVRRFAAGAAR